MLGRQITIRVTPAELKRLQREASARNVTLSSYVRHAICDYLDLKRDLAETLTSDGVEASAGGDSPQSDETRFEGESSPGAPRSRIIHLLLARTEERIAASINSQAERISRLREDLRLVSAMIDRAYFGFLAHTAAVDTNLHSAATASAQRRHGLWLRAVEIFARTGGELRLVPPATDDSEES